MKNPSQGPIDPRCPRCGGSTEVGYLPVGEFLKWRDTQPSSVNLVPDGEKLLLREKRWLGCLSYKAYRCRACAIVTFEYWASPDGLASQAPH